MIIHSIKQKIEKVIHTTAMKKAKNRETNPHNCNEESSYDKAQILDEPHIWGTKLEFKLFTKD